MAAQGKDSSWCLTSKHTHKLASDWEPEERVPQAAHTSAQGNRVCISTGAREHTQTSSPPGRSSTGATLWNRVQELAIHIFSGYCAFPSIHSTTCHPRNKEGVNKRCANLGVLVDDHNSRPARLRQKDPEFKVSLGYTVWLRKKEVGVNKEKIREESVFQPDSFAITLELRVIYQ